MTTFILKLIAILSMTIDHTGAVLGLKYVNGYFYLSGLIPLETYNILRAIGRIAFPIYCYLIVEGYYHTKNVKKYMLRLFSFAIISQIPFSLAVFKSATELKNLNVFFTLFFGLVCVYLTDIAKKQYYMSKEHHNPDLVRYLIGVPVAIILIMILAMLIHTDYDAFGILLILLFYFFRQDQTKPITDKDNAMKFIWLFLSMAASIYVFVNPTELFALVAMLPIALHNHKKGPSMKYVFYAYYPVHLLTLYGIYTLLI